jgi:phage shock protein A
MSDPSEPLEAEIVDEPRPAEPESAPTPVPDYDEHGVPSFDYVRDKIEKRAGTAVGAGELAADTVEGRTLEQQEADRARAAAARLDEIRKSLGR